MTMTLQLEVGKTYRDREGDEVKIVGMRAATPYRYESEHGIHYTADGRFDLEQPGHGFDLIEECADDLTEARSKSCALSCIMAAVEAAHG